MNPKIRKHNSDAPGQLTLFAIAPTEKKITIHDPYWDEIVAPQQGEDNHWNPSDFGEVPRKLDDDGQLTIFYDDTQEPPDPDDFQNRTDYHQAWAEWRIRVGAQVSTGTISSTVELRVGAQAITNTKKVAPQHDTHWVEKYWVERGGNKYWYYRYCWMVGRKKNRAYIGSVSSITAKRKKADIEVWIGDGLSPNQIENLLRSWRGSARYPIPNTQ